MQPSFKCSADCFIQLFGIGLECSAAFFFIHTVIWHRIKTWAEFLQVLEFFLSWLQTGIPVDGLDKVAVNGVLGWGVRIYM